MTTTLKLGTRMKVIDIVTSTYVERGIAHHDHKVYRFPRDAQQYADDVSNDAYPCEHGHIACAVWDGGPCMDEALCAAGL